MTSSTRSGAPTVSAVLVGWNSARYLEDCLGSLAAQTRPPSEVVFVDNGSTDGTVEWLRERRPDVRLVLNSGNVGFCAANNQGIAASTGDHVLLVNTDVVLRPEFIEVLAGELDGDPGLGWGSGKLLRLVPGADPGDAEERVIDSTGEVVLSSRRAVNRGAGEVDRGQYDRREEVFGVTAAAALYRRAMLEDVRLGPDYLDRDYFAYLEDCDLNWRARLRNWRCVYNPAAVGFHVRQHPAGRPVAIRRRAFFNRYLNLIKNETWLNLLLAAPHILAYDAFRALKTFCREPDVLGGVFAFLALVPGALAKRRLIQARRTASSREIRRWMAPERYVEHVLKRCCRRRGPARPTERQAVAAR